MSWPRKRTLPCDGRPSPEITLSSVDLQHAGHHPGEVGAHTTPRRSDDERAGDTGDEQRDDRTAETEAAVDAGEEEHAEEAARRREDADDRGKVRPKAGV